MTALSQKIAQLICVEIRFPDLQKDSNLIGNSLANSSSASKVAWSTIPETVA